MREEEMHFKVNKVLSSRDEFQRSHKKYFDALFNITRVILTANQKWCNGVKEILLGVSSSSFVL